MQGFFHFVAPGPALLYALHMDESVETKLRELAEENGIDPDELIALARQSALPDGLDKVVAAVIGDVATFGRALDKLGE